jgi:two-component system chemotaxis response regulator CheY
MEKGMEIVVASDGEEGLSKIQSLHPDFILLDIILPKMNGFDILIKINEDPALKLIPVIVFSTLGQEKDIEKAKALGVKEVINKSFFDFENLYQKILSYLPKS